MSQGTQTDSNNLEGWDGKGDRRGFWRVGTYVYLWLILIDV